MSSIFVEVRFAAAGAAARSSLIMPERVRSRRCSISRERAAAGVADGAVTGPAGAFRGGSAAMGAIGGSAAAQAASASLSTSARRSPNSSCEVRRFWSASASLLRGARALETTRRASCRRSFSLNGLIRDSSASSGPSSLPTISGRRAIEPGPPWARDRLRNISGAPGSSALMRTSCGARSATAATAASQLVTTSTCQPSDPRPSRTRSACRPSDSTTRINDIGTPSVDVARVLTL